MAQDPKQQIARIQRAAVKYLQAMLKGAGRGSRLHMEKVSTKAKEEAPVLTGNLKGSGRADGPVDVGDGVVSGVGFGAGVSATYAVPVHELHNDFLKRAENSLRGKAMPLLTKEAIKEMQKVKP